jgi:serine/threonine protein kinase/tetratricopeptide (TPR) repeat protein
MSHDVNEFRWIVSRLCIRSAPVLETACPSDDVLGAHIEHALDDREAARVVSHLDRCDACRAIVIAAVRDNGPRIARGTPSTHLAIPETRSLAGTRMGRYELRSLLGAGGMGQVYAAYDAELDREIAVKVLHPELARGAAVLADRLVRESRLMAKIEHPSVITVYDVGRTDDDAVFIAMEIVHGETLGAHLARTKPAWREVTALFERAGAGLSAAHAAGVVHRDFKPDNVLVEGDARKVVVTDFGIAMDAIAYAGSLANATASASTPVATSTTIAAPHAIAAANASRDDDANAAGAIAVNPVDGKPALALGTDRVARLTATGAAIGTPAYMAPEQLDACDVDARADVFAFCVSLWEALFGERPFRGKTIGELRASMTGKPRAPRSDVPSRLVRALERGLAITPVDRWPDMSSLLRELAAVRAMRKRRLFAAAGVGLVGAGIAGALLLAGGTERENPCIATLPAMPTTLPIDDVANARLSAVRSSWRITHAATCSATSEPIQAPAIATCLEARKTEIAAFIDEMQRSGAKASPMARTMLDPVRCAVPRSGLLVARVPVDPSLREAVADLRYRGFAIEKARDTGNFAVALPAAKKLAEDAANSPWPPLRGEVLYLLGTTQALGGDTKKAMETLREAAALAERAHDDYTAGNSWIQLIQSVTFDEGDPVRALEYANYADAALDRLGRPANVEVMFLYYKGTAMMEAGAVNAAKAEVLFRRAVELAERSAPQYLDRALMGLAYLYEGQGKFADAVDVYRRAMPLVKPTDAALHVFHERLSMNLAYLGKAVEAEAEARKAVEIAEKMLSEENADRAITRVSLAQVLQQSGKQREALDELRIGKAAIAKTLGERNLRYGEILSLEASLLVELARYEEAMPILERACEIIAFGVGDHSLNHADCLQEKSATEGNLGRLKQAEATIERALAILVDVDADSARTANAYLQRGELRGLARRTVHATHDLEKAIAIFEKLQIDSGHLGGAKFVLAQVLWPADKARAKRLASEAIDHMSKGSATWAPQVAEARAWLDNPQ